MARKLRVEYEGAIYHVVIRGVERRKVFGDDADRERFVNRLSKYAEEMEVRLYLFCLMNNHIHLLFETPGGNLSQSVYASTANGVYGVLQHEAWAGRAFVPRAIQGDIGGRG
jgi:REP element-mobilizing transposase RayT